MYKLSITGFSPHVITPLPLSIIHFTLQNCRPGPAATRAMSSFAYVLPMLMNASPNPPSSAKRTRKPARYWTNLDNIRAEIIAFNKTADASNLNRMPTKCQLSEAGRRDLDNAITKNGGYIALSTKLGLLRGQRKPPGYWAAFPNLETELRQFLASNVAIPNGGMPTLKELRNANRSDIAEGVAQHGGVRIVAQRLGLQPRSRAKLRGYWDDGDTVDTALRAFIAEHGNNGMPTQRELRDAGRADLADALVRHGGLRAAAGRLGVASRKRRDFYYALFANVAYELYSFAGTGAMPTTAALRQAGRTDLLSAVRRFGGSAAVARRLGLVHRARTRDSLTEWALFRRQLLAFVDRHGTAGMMPSSRKLSNFARDDLYVAALHHGGMRVVADRLSLRVEYLQEFADVAVQVLEFVHSHGSLGIMPTERDLLELGRDALNVSVGKFGYSQMAQRLGLKEPAQSSQVAFDAFLMGRTHTPDEQCSDDDGDDCCENDANWGHNKQYV